MLDEALGQRLVEGVARVVGRQVEVVQRLRRDFRPVTTARPPCRVIRMSPVTCWLASAMKPSRARLSGENHRPS